MNAFTQSISKIFKGSIKAFKTFPTTLACAVAFSIVTIIRIYLDWPQQEAYNFLFNCLHWAFALGAIFNLAAITFAQSRFNQKRAFLIANLLGAAAVIVTFLALYFWGGTNPKVEGARFVMMRGIAISRVSVAMLVSLLAFIILAGYPKDQSDFARSSFMTQKAFFIALLYGLVIMGGMSGVAGAIQALLYREMSSKVYMYIGTLSGFLAFAIFVGYFPDFRKGEVDEHREVAQKQPRFVEILFEYIMIPIVLALTCVLIIWAGKTILNGMKASFIKLSSIATAYTFYGIWLHIMVTHHETGLAKFYRRVYPIAALVILAFEAWALVIQLQKTGLQMTEYIFILTWIIALVSAVLLLILNEKAHTAIVALTCAMAVIAVLPVIGCQDLPVTAQVSRLEKLLINQGMLENNQLIPAVTEPEAAVRESITDAVDYLAYSQDAKLPAWFDKHLGDPDVFKTKLGFEKKWSESDNLIEPGNGAYMNTSLYLPSGAIDISGYQWVIDLREDYEKENKTITVKGKKGLYSINWNIVSQNNIPILKIELDNRLILQQDMNDYIDKITAKFPPGNEQYKAALEDMSLKLDTPEVSVLLIFRDININLDPQQDIIGYYLNLDSLYIREK